MSDAGFTKIESPQGANRRRPRPGASTRDAAGTPGSRTPGRRWPGRRVLAALLACLIVPGLSGPAAAKKKYRATSYRSDAEILVDGSLRVRETIEMRFDGGPYRFFYRGIPTTRTDGIKGLAASDSFQVKKRRKQWSVTWHFAPVRDTTLTFRLEYLLTGAVSVDPDRERLAWIPFPGERAYVIDTARVAVLLPPGIQPLGYSARAHGRLPSPPRFTVEEPLEAQSASPGTPANRRPRETLLLSPLPLPGGRTVGLRIDLPPGSLEGPAPEWQVRQGRWRARTPVFLILATLLLGTGLISVLRLRGSLRDRQEAFRGVLPSGPVSPRSSPPDNLVPPLAGTLSRGSVLYADALAGLFSLAQRGVVRIECPRKRSGIFASPPLLVRATPPSRPAPWETALLEAAFSRADTSGSVSMSKARAGIAKRFKEFSRIVLQELERSGHLDVEAQQARAVLYRTALYMLIAGCVLFVGAVFFVQGQGPALLAVPVAGLVVAGVTAILGSAYPLWTPSGAQKALAWKGFGRFLKETAREMKRRGSTRVAVTEELFHAWLPLAVVLGCGDAWLRGGRRQGYRPPSWYVPPAGSEADFGALITIVAAAASGGGSGGASGGAGGSSGAG